MGPAGSIFVYSRLTKGVGGVQGSTDIDGVEIPWWHFLPRTSVFRWVGVGWGGANNVPWHLTFCYACTCGYATRTWV